MTKSFKAGDFRHLFALNDDIAYFDGNSLGVPTHETLSHINAVAARQWAVGLVGSWNEAKWIDLPQKVGDKIGAILGAPKGQTICCDSISVNLFKILTAISQSYEQPIRLLSTYGNFPSDLYVAQGVTRFAGDDQIDLIMCDENALIDHIADSIDIVMVTEVNFKTGHRLDLKQIVEKTHKAGGLVIVDVAHSAGATPIDLLELNVDFAVGCTYKFLNGGPGAPGFVYQHARHNQRFQQPIWGWMGHEARFAFDEQYQPASGVRQMLSGTPAILSMSAVDSAVDLFSLVTTQQLYHAAQELMDAFLRRVSSKKSTCDLQLVTKVKAPQRASQLSFRHQYAYEICRCLNDWGVVADFRAPDILRFGFAPMYNNDNDVEKAVNALESIMNEQLYLNVKLDHREEVT